MTQNCITWTEVCRSKDGTRALFSRPLDKKTAYVEERCATVRAPACTFVHGTNKKKALVAFNNPRYDLPFMVQHPPKHDAPKNAPSTEKPVEKAPLPVLAIGESGIGKLKFFDAKKGFGFLAVPGYADVFICWQGVPKELDDDMIAGTSFPFTIVKDEKHGKTMAVITVPIVEQQQMAA